MITLETGVPGAGKTLYCIDKLLRPLIGATVKHEVDGQLVEVPRRIFTNINGLLLDHTKIGPGAEWTRTRDGEWTQDKAGDKLGLNNWHEWAKPGDVIIYDEVQKPWPLIAAGAPVPPCITALETHRHMGVDFIVLTQHPMLISANLVRLVGRHLHVRRMGNMGLAIVYEWDSASRTLLYKNALAKAPYRYDKAVFQLYKSAEVHTKQPRRVPTLVFGVLFALLLIAYFAPATYSRIGDRINPKPATPAAQAPAGSVAAPMAAALGVGASGTAGAPTAPASAPAEPVVAGCVMSAGRCNCYADSGKRLVKPAEFCRDQLADLDGAPAKTGKGLMSTSPASAGDGGGGGFDLLGAYGGRRGASL